MKKRKTSTRLISLQGLLYIRYLPRIIHLVSNWVTFLLNYVGMKNDAQDYRFRDGSVLKTNEGLDSTTIAVVFIKKDYDRILTIGNNGNTIVDIGANIGAFSIYAAQELENSTVYAYEPVPANFGLLRENIEANNLGQRVKCFGKAVGGQNEKRKLYLKTSPQHSLYSRCSTLDSEGYIDVECITLEQAFDQNGIETCDLLKVDAEGAEYEIFYNAAASHLAKVRNCILEYHNMPHENNCNARAIKNYMISRGFSVANIADDGDTGVLWCKNMSSHRL